MARTPILEPPVATVDVSETTGCPAYEVSPVVHEVNSVALRLVQNHVAEVHVEFILRNGWFRAAVPDEAVQFVREPRSSFLNRVNLRSIDHDLVGFLSRSRTAAHLSPARLGASRG